MKFRKRITVFPGLTINLSKSSMSATIGLNGFNINIGKNGTYLNTGIPGTGIYDRTKLNKPVDTPPHIHPQSNHDVYNLIDIDNYNIIEIKSLEPKFLTSGEMFGVKKIILESKKEKDRLKDEDISAERKYILFGFFMCVSFLILIGLPFIKILINKFKHLRQYSKEIRQAYINYKLDIDLNLDKDIENIYLTLQKSFDDVTHSNKIWSVTMKQNIDRIKARSFASTIINRSQTTFIKKELDFIKTKYAPITLKNTNGLFLYFYPCFLIVISENDNDFAVISYDTIKITQQFVNFSETEPVPSDSKVTGYTYQYVNKNGAPDRRYKYNPQIPIALYYQIYLYSESGLNESYLISNATTGGLFGELLSLYLDIIKKLQWSSAF